MVGIKERFIVTNIKIVDFNCLLSCFFGGIEGDFPSFCDKTLS